MQNENANIGVSIIVPVYNVERYVHCCIDSILHQTDKSYELIIINDGSTDGSAEICKSYLKESANISYYEQTNQGLGPARMNGIKESKYPYITFVDSDDWISESYVEKMLGTAIKTDSDIVYCDCVYVNNSTGIQTNAHFRTNLKRARADKELRLSYGYPNMWGAIYKKSIWVKNSIYAPGLIYEDTATYGIILEYYKKIECCEEGLYYYRTGRNGSLMQQGIKKPELMEKALSYFLEEAKGRNIFKKNRDAYLSFCARQIQIEWEKAINLFSKEDISRERALFTDLLNKFFDGWERKYDRKCIAIGSYNSCAVFNRIVIFREKMENKYQFASIIDMATSIIGKEQYKYRRTKNIYRLSMIKKIMSENFEDHIEEDSIIILDLLNEATDIIKIGDQYLSKSEALMETVDLHGKLEIIPKDDEERFSIWKQAVEQFMEIVRKKRCKAFLLKLFFCTLHGEPDNLCEYDDKNEIENDNKLLSRYYDFFMQNMPELNVIELPRQFVYTDKDFPFGVTPDHLNEFSYQLLANAVISKL